MLGFDHHCTLLNNCVGKRNLRSFISLLMSAWTFYLLTGLIAAFAILYVPERDEYLFEGGIKLDYQSVVSIIILVLQIVKFVLLCCLKHCVTFGQAIAWVVLEAFICLGLAITTLQGEIMAGAPMLSLGLSFMLIIWPLLTKHLNFIAHHLTEKEFHARMETMNRLQV